MQAYKTVTATFLSGKTRPVKWRQEQLTQLGLLVVRAPVQAFNGKLLNSAD